MLFALLYILSTGAFLKYNADGRIGDLFVTPKMRFHFYDFMIDVFGINILFFFIWSIDYGLQKLFPKMSWSDLVSWLLGIVLLFVLLVYNRKAASTAKPDLDKY